MTTSTPDEARAHARAMIGRALISDNGKGGIAAAFTQLETRLRQPYAYALTETDRHDIRAYLTARLDVIIDLLNSVEVPERVWSQAEFEELKQDVAK